MSEHHTILGGKVHVYKRPNSSSWQCASFLAGKNRRAITKEDSLSKAKEVAEDWYLQLRGKLRDGELKSGKLFREAAKLYLREFAIITRPTESDLCAWTARADKWPPDSVFWPHGASRDHGWQGQRISSDNER
jgi:hypothetical protein